MGLLHLRSESLQRFKMSATVSPDDIFFITEHFVTKCGMVMRHHSQSVMQKFFFSFFFAIVKITAGGSYDLNMTFYYIF